MRRYRDFTPSANNPHEHIWLEPSRFNFLDFDKYRKALDLTFDAHIAHRYDDHQIVRLMVKGDERDAKLMRKLADRVQGSTPRIGIEVYGPVPY